MDVFRELYSSSQDHITALPPDININGISGKMILPHRKVLLSLSLSSQEPDICDYFYIVSDVSFNADLLVGFNTMCKYDISLFPAINEITEGDTYISTVLL